MANILLQQARTLQLLTMKPQECTILIVDDFKTNALVVESILNKVGYQSVLCDSGNVALQILQDITIDLILLDVVMPGISGFEVAKILKADKKFSSIPIIFFTTQSEEEQIAKGFEVGGEDYIFKPLREKELLARVKTHLELKNKRERLEKMNLRLEEAVYEKTQQLSRALKELENAYKKLENANIQLHNLNKAKSDFIKIISHEIRTPLNGIVGFTELIKASNKSEELLDYVNILGQSVNRLEDFANDALLISELQTGDYQPFFTRESLKPFLVRIVKSVKLKNPAKRFGIKYEQCDTCEIEGDIALLTRAIENIIQNAIEHSPEDSTIFIKVQHKENKVRELQIVDSGKGFSQEAVDTLFQLFSSGTSHIDKNPGLGLAMVKMIMDLHSGEVSAKNNVDTGATVTLSFSNIF